MNLWDIVKNVGSGIVREVVPGGNLLMAGINELLPDDKKLPADATGKDIGDAVASLPPDQRASVMNKEFDVQITQIKESNATVRAMLDADTKTPHTTRPYIAKGSFKVVAFTVITTISIWAYGVLKGDEKLIAAVVNGWPFVLAVIAPLVVLLHAYFGVLKNEQKNKLDAANGVSNPSGLTGLITGILKR